MTTAFLIEGKEGEEQKFPETLACYRLARENNALIFDAIESYSAAHLSAVLQVLPEQERPLLAVSTYIDFSEEGSADDIIKKIIYPGFKQFSEETGTELPRWLENLNSTNLAAFITQQLQEHFSGSSETYKEYARGLRKKMRAISDQLSSESFIDFLRKNPEVDNVQALIGSHHINFLDHVSGFLVIDEKEHLKKISIACDGRGVLVSLYHGTHGDMKHFEAMSKACREIGFTIPEANSRSHDINELVIKAFLASLTQTNRDGLFSIPSPRKTKTAVFNLHDASMQFDYWMKNYTHPAELSHKQELVDWLFADSGAELVDNYTNFCKLAEHLTTMGYHLSPPPLEKDFNAGIQEHTKMAERFAR